MDVDGCKGGERSPARRAMGRANVAAWRKCPIPPAYCNGRERGKLRGRGLRLAVALAGGDPLPPFVVGVKGDGEDQSDDEDEEPEHGGNRIARMAGWGSHPYREEREAGMGDAANCAGSAAGDEDGEAAGDHGRAAVGIFRRWCGPRAELGGDEVDAVSGGVVTEGAGAAHGAEGFDGGVAGLGGVNHGEDAFSAGDEDEVIAGAPADGVRAFADGGVGEELAGSRVEDGHLFAFADREEAMAGAVKGEAGG